MGQVVAVPQTSQRHPGGMTGISGNTAVRDEPLTAAGGGSISAHPPAPLGQIQIPDQSPESRTQQRRQQYSRASSIDVSIPDWTGPQK